MQRNRVLLINTLPRADYWSVQKEPQLGMPLGLLSIGTVLKQSGYDARIIDPLVDKGYMQTIGDNLQDCLLVGVSVMTAGIGSALQISKFVKSIDKSIPVIWGGVHPTLLPEQTLANENIDYICWGEGEQTCLDLANALRSGLPVKGIEGLGFKDNGRTVVNKRLHFLNPDDLPMPLYDLLNMEKYLYRDLGTLTNVGGKVRVCVLNTGLGCPYQCSFCYNTHPSQRYRPKSLGRVLAEVDGIVSKFNPDVIHIQDDLFFADKKRAMGFFDEYERRGYHFNWFALARVNYFGDNYLSEEYLERIKSHCLWLGLGIESGNVAVRERLRKDVSETDIWQAVSILAKSKINTGYAFMVGMPGETKYEMIDTVEMILKIKRCHPRGSFIYQLFRPYPGTQLFNEAVEEGYEVPGGLEQWIEALDTSTGYTELEKSVWIKDKGFVRYLLNAVEWSLFSPVVIGESRTAKRVLVLLCKVLLKYPFLLSLKVRLFFNCWGLYWENYYCRMFHIAYGFWGRRLASGSSKE